MDYGLAKQLKDAGWPQVNNGLWIDSKGEKSFHIDLPDGDCPVGADDLRWPTLSELIEACGERFHSLHRGKHNNWYAKPKENTTWRECAMYKTPEEAVAMLWIELNKK